MSEGVARFHYVIFCEGMQENWWTEFKREISPSCLNSSDTTACRTRWTAWLKRFAVWPDVSIVGPMPVANHMRVMFFFGYLITIIHRADRQK